MEQAQNFLDDGVGFLIKRAPSSVLIDLVSRAHKAEINEATRELVERTHAYLFWEGGLPKHVPKKPSNQSLIKFYQRFGHLIPEEYRKEGVRRAEEPKELKYDPATGTVYVEKN